MSTPAPGLGPRTSAGASDISTPSSYSSGPVSLTQAGVGGPIDADASEIIVAIHTAPAANILLIGFGNSLAEAQANIDGTVGSEQGKVLAFPSFTGTLKAGDVSFPVGVPVSLATPYFAIAEAHATPTGKVMVTQEV